MKPTSIQDDGQTEKEAEGEGEEEGKRVWGYLGSGEEKSGVVTDNFILSHPIPP